LCQLKLQYSNSSFSLIKTFHRRIYGAALFLFREQDFEEARFIENINISKRSSFRKFELWPVGTTTHRDDKFLKII